MSTTGPLYQINVAITLTLDHAPAVHADQVMGALWMVYSDMRENRTTSADKTFVLPFSDGCITFCSSAPIEMLPTNGHEVPALMPALASKAEVIEQMRVQADKVATPEPRLIDGKTLPANIPDYQLRVLLEKDALDVKLVALQAFIGTEAFRELPVVQQDLLAQQHSAMDRYSKVLAERIKTFGIDFKG